MDRDQRLEQARQICARGDFAVAYTLYETLLRTYPDDPEVLQAYGRAKYQEYDDLEQAAALFARAYAAAPESVESLLWLADLAALGYGPGYERAAELYHQAIQLDPEAVDAYLGLGMLHRTPDRPVSLDDAVAAFQRATQLAPQRADAQLDLGMALIEAGQRQAAREPLRVGAGLLRAAGNERQAQSVQTLLDRLERDEPITATVYTLDSPRYRS